MEDVKQLAEEHWVFLEHWRKDVLVAGIPQMTEKELGHIFKYAFIHGYKHGLENRECS